MQIELETAQDLKAGAEQLVQELTAANETIAELQSEMSRHQSTAATAQSQVKVCFTAVCILQVHRPLQCSCGDTLISYVHTVATFGFCTPSRRVWGEQTHQTCARTLQKYVKCVNFRGGRVLATGLHRTCLAVIMV
jgi:hypothetical protein